MQSEVYSQLECSVELTVAKCFILKSTGINLTHHNDILKITHTTVTHFANGERN